MASIFDRIRAKAQQAFTGIGNSIDRDQSMGGVQLAKGGLGNRIGQAVGNVARSVSNTPLVNQPNADVINYPIKAPTIGDAGRFVRDNIIRPAPRAIETLTSSVGQAIGASNGVTSPEQIASGMPYKPARDFFYGENPEPILSLQNQTANNAPRNASWLQDRGVSPGLAQGVSTPLTFLGVTGLAALDAVPADPTDFLKAGGKATLKEALPLVDDVAREALPLVDDVLRTGKKVAPALDEVLQPALQAVPGKAPGIPTLKSVGAELGRIRAQLKQATDPEIITDLTEKEGFFKQAFSDLKNEAKKGAPPSQEILDAAESAKGVLFKNPSFFGKTWDQAMTQTPQRLEKVFGKPFYGEFVQPMMDSLSVVSKTADDFVSSNLKAVGDVAQRIGVTKGSKDSGLLRLFGEKDGLAKVTAQVGQERANQLLELYQTMRSQNDQIYDTLAPISEGLGKVLFKKDNFLSKQSVKKGIDLTTDSGVSSELSSSLFKKQSAETVADPMESFALYVNRSANLLLEPEAKKFAQLRESLSKNPNTSQEMLSELSRLEQNITGAGKETTGIERTFNQVFGKAKEAAVVGKVSTLANQALGLPAGVANAGFLNTIKGNLDPAVRQAVKEESSLMSSLSRDVPSVFKDQGFYSKMVDGARGLLQKANKVMYEIPMRGFAQQAKEAGATNVDEMIKVADREAARVLGDRRAWATPEFYNTFLGKLLAPFTQEQTAQAASFLQNIGDKKAGKVISTLVAWKVAGDVWQKVSGFDPYFDPTQAIQESAELFQGSDTKEQNELKAFMRLVEEGLVLVPPIQSMINQGYSVGESVGLLPDSNKVFANDRTWMSTGSLLNPLSNVKLDFKDGVNLEGVQPRSITGNKIADVGLNVGAKYFPGLEQVNRTVQGANTLARGYAVSKAGNPMYQAPDNPLEQLKAVTVGQSSTKNAQDFFDNDFSGFLNKKQKAALDLLPTKEQKLDFLQSVQPANEQVNKLKSKTKQTTDSLGGNAKASGLDASTKAGKEALTDYVTTLLDAGQVPDQADIKNSIFSGKSATSKSIEERMDTYSALKTAMNDEFRTPEQKQAILGVSEASPELYEYYNMASKDQDVRLQEILPKLDNMDTPAIVESLMKGRRKVAGKQLVSNDMVDYLYENDYISKDEQKAIKALKWDEINDKPYLSKSYTKSKSGSLSYSQAKKLFNVELPKFSRLKSLDYLSKSLPQGGSQRAGGDDRLIDTLLNAPNKRRSGSGNLWF